MKGRLMPGKPGQSSDLPVTPPPVFDPNFLDAMDGRSAVARELKRRLAELETDLGGHDQLSYQQRSLARRTIFLEYRVETFELELAEGKAVNLDDWVKVIAALVRVLNLLGLKRRAKELHLKDYLAGSRRAAREASA